jgi:serine/threonine protein kinase
MAWTSGQQVDKYRIVRELGRGGFGVTYLAQNSANRPVVIKAPNEDILNHPQTDKLLQDFLNEALKLARCQHPHVVRVIELIKQGRLDAMVMEYVEGQNLLDRLISRNQQPNRSKLRGI